MSENPAEYRKTPPMLRPLNAEENGRHEITARQNQRLEKDLTMAHIQLGDRHAELRMMRVAVEVLTGRALKAEARVKEQQAELAEQEVNKLRLIQETHNWSAAVKKLEAERVAKPDLKEKHSGFSWPCTACLAESPNECIASDKYVCVFAPAWKANA